MIAKEEVENIAMLAKLSVTQEEYPCLLLDLQQMTEFAGMVKDADVSLLMESKAYSRESFCREDEPCSSYPRSEILANAPANDGEFFLVRKRA